jgi:two-component system sensor histidine kinase VicK
METFESVSRQLSESLKREKELQERLNDLTDFIENAAMPLHWVNGSGVIIWANKVELDMMGYAAEEYIGKHISNFHSDTEVIEDILVRLTSKETLIDYPALLRTKTGTIIPVLINSNVRWDGSDFIHTRCFTRNISDMKKLENEKASLINDLNEKIRILTAENTTLKKRHNTHNAL